MRAESRRRGRRWLSLLLTLAMVWTLVSGALAMNVNRSGAQTVTVTMEYTDESGRTMYYLPPTQVELEEGTYFVADLIGLKVVDADDPEKVYGTLTQVSSTGANDVYHILFPNGKTYYIPAIPQVVEKTDIENGVMLIRPLEGLFE